MAPWIFEIEWMETGLGQYGQRQTRAWTLDWVFDQLMEKNIYCQLNHMIHDELRTDVFMGWNSNPYNNDNGGVCTAPHQFLTNETAIALYQRKLRYINARWGFSPHLALWEHISEADNTQLYNSHKTDLLNWLNTMTVFIESIDQYNRPISTGFAIPQHDEAYWNNYNTDFTQLHIYGMDPDLEMRIYNLSKWYMDTWNKPHIVSEFSLAHDPNEVFAADPTGISFHNMLWSSMFSGSFASAMSWWWDNYLYPNGLFSYFEPIATFFAQIEEDVSAFQPVVPLCNASGYSPILIDPDYNNQNGKAPENYFHFEPSGLMYPNQLFLGRFIFGSLYGNRRNPPTFKVTYQQAGEFKVRTGSTAVLSKIKIKLNGNTVLDKAASTNSTYTINVPPGNHEIRVENSSLGICEIRNYQLHNYAPDLRSFAWKNDKNAAGWIQNRNYNWQNVNQNGEPPAITDGTIFFDDITPGVYEIKWYDSDGVYDYSEHQPVAENHITIATPEIVWDAAFQLKYISPVQVAFSGTPLNGDAPLTVQFTDESVNLSGAVLAWNWNFGDGNTSDLQNPQHTYQTPGVYTVTLEITSGQYVTAFTRQDYIQAVQPLVADFTSDTTVALINQPVQFTDLSLGDPAQWTWSFGNNTFSFNQNPSKSYPLPGSYTVSLMIQKGNKTDMISKPGYILIIPPLEAGFSSDKTIAAVNEPIQFSDNSSGNPQNYFWDFGDGNTSAQAQPSHQYNQPGVYSVKLKVSNAYLEDSLLKENYITVPEILVADFAASPQSAWPGQPIQFTDLSAGAPANWFWHFGDGTSSAEQNPEYAYSQPGLYSVGLEIWDDVQNDYLLKEDYIHVKQPLVADFEAAETVVFQNERIQFSDLSLGDPMSWLWHFETLGTDQQRNPNIRFSQLGSYDVSLTIFRNDSSDMIVKEDYITVIPPLVADFEADTLLAYTGHSIQFTDLTSGNPQTWFWSFGEEINSSEQNPQIAFNTPGIYAVSLAVSNQYLSDTAVKSNYIQIIEPLTAGFLVTPFEGKIGQVIKFSDTSSGYPEQWEWWFGNGDTAYVQNPTTVFHEAGLFDVTLIVANAFESDTLFQPEYYHIMPPAYSQTIHIGSGWSGISTFVNPLSPAISDVLSPVSDRLQMAFNEQGIYHPASGVNTIQVWNPARGLVTFLSDTATLTIQGYSHIEAPVMLDAGWSVLPVISSCNQPLTELSDILGNNLKLIKEIAGWKIWWPEMGIQTLNELETGKSYYIYLFEPQIFTFPGCD
jgi:PKD repeat protein